MTERSVRWPVL